MNEFAKAFRQERVARRITLREIGVHVNKSIGYLSDLEHGRKTAPDTDTVRKIEEALGIDDGRLVTIAARVRSKAPSSIAQLIRMKPQLKELLLRADNLEETELDKLINDLRTEEG